MVTSSDVFLTSTFCAELKNDIFCFTSKTLLHGSSKVILSYKTNLGVGQALKYTAKLITLLDDFEYMNSL